MLPAALGALFFTLLPCFLIQYLDIGSRIKEQAVLRRKRAGPPGDPGNVDGYTADRLLLCTHELPAIALLKCHKLLGACTLTCEVTQADAQCACAAQGASSGVAGLPDF